MYQTLFLDYKQAMRDKDALKKGVLTLVISAVKNIEREQGRLINEDEFIAVLNREIKQTKQALEGASNAGRQELVEKEQKKIELLTTYLPPQMLTTEAISILIQNGVTTGMKMGDAMKIAKPLLNGKLDNGTISTVVKSLIAIP